MARGEFRLSSYSKKKKLEIIDSMNIEKQKGNSNIYWASFGGIWMRSDWPQRYTINGEGGFRYARFCGQKAAGVNVTCNIVTAALTESPTENGGFIMDLKCDMGKI